MILENPLTSGWEAWYKGDLGDFIASWALWSIVTSRSHVWTARMPDPKEILKAANYFYRTEHNKARTISLLQQIVRDFPESKEANAARAMFLEMKPELELVREEPTGDNKKCPYCAETIKAEAIKCRFCGSDLNANPEPLRVSEQNHSPTVAACSVCNVAMISTKKKKSVSASGIVSVILFVLGVLSLFLSVIGGAIIIILGLVIGMMGGRKTVMVCPQCGKEGARLD